MNDLLKKAQEWAEKQGYSSASEKQAYIDGFIAQSKGDTDGANDILSKVAKDAEDLRATKESLSFDFNSWAQTEAGQEAIALANKDKKTGEISQDMQSILDLVRTGVEFSTATQQIKAGQSEASKLGAPPTSPTIPAPSRDLAEAQDIARSRMATPTSAPEYNAMMTSDALNRARAFETAKIASQGQGSQLQAFAQSSANQANQQALQNAGVLQNTRLQAEGQFGNIANQRSMEAARLAQMQNQMYQYNTNNYYNQLASARAAESMGRQNRIQAWQNAAGTLAPALTRAYTGLGDSIDEFYNKNRTDLNDSRNMSFGNLNQYRAEDPFMGYQPPQQPLMLPTSMYNQNWQ